MDRQNSRDRSAERTVDGLTVEDRERHVDMAFASEERGAVFGAKRDQGRG